MDVHDSMLFRWVGHDIEQPDERGWSAPRRTELRSNARLDKQRTDTYLGFLRDALNPNCGLRVSAFSDADLVGKGNPLGRRAPCLFLTEQSASDPDEHWRLYGRLGFGFSKRFIFERGGRPVVYAGGRSDAVIQTISYLRKRLSDKFTNPDHPIHSRFEFLAQHIKCTQLPPRPVNLPLPVPGVVSTKGQKGTKPSPQDRPAAEAEESLKFDYPAQKSIRFLREREWRLFWSDRDALRWHTDASGNKWFRPKLGSELQIIILPNNHLLRSAWACERIRAATTPEGGPPVQLVSAQALRKL